MYKQKNVLFLILLAIVSVLFLASCQSTTGSQTNGGSGGDGVIVSATAERFSGKNDKLRVRIETSAKTELTVKLDDGSSETRNCNNQCQLVFNKVSDASGKVTITDGNDTVEVSYTANE